MAHRVRIEIDRLRRGGITTLVGLARELTTLGVPAPRRRGAWTHTTVARVIGRGRRRWQEAWDVGSCQTRTDA